MGCGYEPTQTSGLFTGLLIVSIRTCCRRGTGLDSAVRQGALGWITTSACMEALVRGNVHKELGRQRSCAWRTPLFRKPQTHSPKSLATSLWQSLFPQKPDLFLQPVCFWKHAADEAEAFVPLWSDPRQHQVLSVARLQMWSGLDRQGILISSCHRQATRLQYRPSLFCACRGWAAAVAASPQAGHLLGSWDQPEGQIQPWKTASRMACRSKGSTKRHPLETF